MKQRTLLLVALLLGMTSARASAQSCTLPDGFEEDDTCATASLFGGNLCQFGLSVQSGDTDWFGSTIAPGEKLVFNVRGHNNGADIRLQVKEGCSPTVLFNVLTPGPEAAFEWENTTASSMDIRIAVFLTVQGTVSCSFYDVAALILEPTPGCSNDDLEPNNCCVIATTLSGGVYDLTLQSGNQDWYKVVVPSFRVAEFYATAPENFSMTLWEDCFGTFVETSTSRLRVTNVTAASKTYLLQVRSTGTNAACFPYQLRFTLPASSQQFCQGNGGDGMGCSDCLCGNNAPPSSGGGCLNGSGSSARLLPAGFPSISNPTLNFGMNGANPLSFAVLSSGDNLAPDNPANPCYGLGSGALSAAFDGLRCAVGNTQRHGGRACDSNGSVGSTNNGWGPPAGPMIGLLAQGGFVLGQSRYWQVVYREDPTLVCGKGLNTTQAVLTLTIP